jgi:hypothetical protein
MERKGAQEAVELLFGVGAVQAQRFSLSGCHGRPPEPNEVPFARQLGGGRCLGGVASTHFRIGGSVWNMGLKLDEKFHRLLLPLPDQSLSAVDVVCRAGDRGVDHEMNRECGDVGWSDHTPDWKRGAQFISPGFEPVAEERRRQRGVDKAGGDEVDPNGCELKGEGGREWR